MRIPRIIFLSTTLGIVLSGAIAAQTALFTVEAPDPTRVIQPYGATEFHIAIKNTTADSITVNVRRTQNALSDNEWYSALCFINQCYPPNVDTPDPVTIAAGDTRECKLIVASGMAGRASVKLQFTVGDVSITKEFGVSVATSGVGDQRQEWLRLDLN